MVSIKLTVSTFALLALLGQYEARPVGPEDQDEVTQIEAAFKTADTDGDGQITKDQLKQVIWSWDTYMYTFLTDNQVDAMLDIVMVLADSDEDNMVGESDVVKAICTDAIEANDAYFAAFFKVFDKDNNGGLNLQELTEVDRRMRKGNYAAQGMLAHDQDGDAEISHQEIKDARDSYNLGDALLIGY